MTGCHVPFPGRPGFGFLAGTVLAAGLLAALSPAGAQAQISGQIPTPAPAADSNAPDTGADTLLGDIGGLRPRLDRHGLTVTLQETSEVLGNLSGGLKRGAAYDGVTQAGLLLDLAKAFGWDGGLFTVSGLQIHGRNFSADYLGNLQTASGIAADRATRLWELWYQQSLLDGRLDVKIGQQSVDQEFLVSQGSGLFINTMMGWPMIPSADLYAGGPAYPMASPGIRLRGQAGAFTLLGGVFNDNPPGGPFGDDPQSRNASGTRFNFNTGTLFLAELQYQLNPPAADGRDGGLPGSYKLGAWYDTAAFPDQRFDKAGLSLADPAGNGIARLRRRNASLYAVADQTVWRPDPAGARALALFARIMGAPADRNPVDLSINAGITLKAPFPGRDSDALGLGFGIARVSHRAAELDRDTALFSDGSALPRASETFLELTYQYQVTSWWMLQPDAQYVISPGAGARDPSHPDRRLKDEAVLGLRSVLTF